MTIWPKKRKPPVAATTEGVSKAEKANDQRVIANIDESGNRNVTFRAPDGATWVYRGKRVCILQIFPSILQYVTQLDCYPWRTRLGGTTHAMRGDGLARSTEVEGPYRHARYRLATRLVGDFTTSEHRLKNN